MMPITKNLYLNIHKNPICNEMCGTLLASHKNIMRTKVLVKVKRTVAVSGMSTEALAGSVGR